MKLFGGDVTVASGTGFSNGIALPLVRMTVESEGESITINMTPGHARTIGLDMIGAGSSAWADAAVRTYAKEHGVDGDGIVAYIKTMIKADLEIEE